jgi:ribonucleoside-diphosphate reductase beta chain
MSLLKARPVYKPFTYPEYYDLWKKAHQSHWMADEVSMASDINDWKTVLTDSERQLVGHILKGFTVSEIFIEDYWSSKISRWFKVPEIQMMAHTFAAFESIHADGYDKLNSSLGLEDYEAFMHEPATKAKIDRLMVAGGKSKIEIAKSLAVFSAFNEGVNLFSSFAILLNFTRFNKMKGMGQIISWSINDEQLHSQAGCMLFNQLVKENPEIWNDELKKDLYDAARITIELEDNFIDKAFELGEVQGLTKHQMKNFIRHRANEKLQEIGLKSNWRNLDKIAIDEMQWFSVLSQGVSHADFFAGKVTDYAKSNQDWDKIWEKE